MIIYMLIPNTPKYFTVITFLFDDLGMMTVDYANDKISLFISIALFLVDSSFTEDCVECCKDCSKEGSENEEEVQERRSPFWGVHLRRSGHPPGEEDVFLLPLAILPVNIAPVLNKAIYVNCIQKKVSSLYSRNHKLPSLALSLSGASSCQTKEHLSVSSMLLSSPV